MNTTQLYVYFKPLPGAASAGLGAWLAAAQAVRAATPGLQLQCLTRIEASGADTWMETYAGLPLAALEAAQAQMARHTEGLGVQRHTELFSLR